ncbi:IS30 family transposase [Clostridia bacterium]|nr:IS30 family transposase [Clostridia bacterium]
MGQTNSTTTKAKSQHLKYDDRIKIEALRKAGHSAREIGQIVCKSKRQINRELKIGEVELKNSDLTTRIEYSADVSQKVHDKRKSGKGPREKLGSDIKFAKYVADNIDKYHSPYSVLQKIKLENLKFETQICLRTLYSYIDKGYIPGLTNRDLPCGGKHKKRGYNHVRPIRNAKGTCISERPESVEEREEFGHFEMDLVCGKQGTHSVLLVLTERKSRNEIIRKLPDKRQETIIAAIDKLEIHFGAGIFRKIFKSITTDNGSEFLGFEAIERSAIDGEKRTQHYFCHPQCSWERGSNERFNREIRRWIPKGVDIGGFSDEYVAEIEQWLNEYPRAILGGMTAKIKSGAMAVAA